MSELKSYQELEVVDRGPDWLFVRLRPDYDNLNGVADRLWDLMNRQFIHRLVLEMDEVDFLPSVLMGQLVMLHKRVLHCDGALRLCGLNSQCLEALRICRLDQALPHFDCRVDAVHGTHLGHPK